MIFEPASFGVHVHDATTELPVTVTDEARLQKYVVVIMAWPALLNSSATQNLREPPFSPKNKRRQFALLSCLHTSSMPPILDNHSFRVHERQEQLNYSSSSVSVGMFYYLRDKGN